MQVLSTYQIKSLCSLLEMISYTCAVILEVTSCAGISKVLNSHVRTRSRMQAGWDWCFSEIKEMEWKIFSVSPAPPPACTAILCQNEH